LARGEALAQLPHQPKVKGLSQSNAAGIRRKIFFAKTAKVYKSIASNAISITLHTLLMLVLNWIVK
jgi:hypothetical protein